MIIENILKVRALLDNKMSTKGLETCKSLLLDGKTVEEVVVLLETDKSNFVEEDFSFLGLLVGVSFSVLIMFYSANYFDFNANSIVDSWYFLPVVSAGIVFTWASSWFGAHFKIRKKNV